MFAPTKSIRAAAVLLAVSIAGACQDSTQGQEPDASTEAVDTSSDDLAALCAQAIERYLGDNVQSLGVLTGTAGRELPANYEIVTGNPALLQELDAGRCVTADAGLVPVDEATEFDQPIVVVNTAGDVFVAIPK